MPPQVRPSGAVLQDSPEKPDVFPDEAFLKAAFGCPVPVCPAGGGGGQEGEAIAGGDPGVFLPQRLQGGPPRLCGAVDRQGHVGVGEQAEVPLQALAQSSLQEKNLSFGKGGFKVCMYPLHQIRLVRVCQVSFVRKLSST